MLFLEDVPKHAWFKSGRLLGPLLVGLVALAWAGIQRLRDAD